MTSAQVHFEQLYADGTLCCDPTTYDHGGCLGQSCPFISYCRERDALSALSTQGRTAA